MRAKVLVQIVSGVPMQKPHRSVGFLRGKITHMQKQNPLYSQKLISEAELTEHIDKLAGEIIQKFTGQNPLFICLLRGGMPFTAQLMFAITKQDPHFHPELDYMTVSSYGSELTASEPRIVMDISYKSEITGRPVIVVDDMIDKGSTYIFTKKHLQNKGAESVYLAALVQRKAVESREFDADFYCFNVDSQQWLTGMGLDDPRIAKEANRWARYIAIANPQD